MAGVTPVEPARAADRELVARCRVNDMAAFNELVQRHQQRAYNVAYQLLRNHEDAIEVAQDAFVRIYRNITAFRGDCEFTTWLHQIVVNLAHNRRRWWQRRGRERTFSLDEAGLTDDGMRERQVASDTPGPDADAVQDEFLRRLDQAMAALPQQFREVLVLRNVEQMSYHEIAVALRCSVGTVKSRIARAREVLRHRLQVKS